jgi:phage-related protein
MNWRFFILDKFNTWHDWRCTVTAKSVPPAEPKTNYVEIDGAHGALDLSEALTGGPVYGTRTVTASFMCSEGTHREREALLRRIRTALHGRRVPIIEPDDPDHYFLGRVKVVDPVNNLAYMTFTIEAVCDPWRYAVNETNRAVTVNGSSVDLVIRNEGDQTLCPVITVAGSVSLTFDGVTTKLKAGGYKVTSLRLANGPNVITVAGSGSVVFTYREAVL